MQSSVLPGLVSRPVPGFAISSVSNEPRVGHRVKNRFTPYSSPASVTETTRTSTTLSALGRNQARELERHLCIDRNNLSG